jgi:hypothetical protein
MSDTKKVTDDDAFIKAKNEVEMGGDPGKKPFDWPQSLRWFPGSKWERNTWYGLSAIFCGGCIQAAFGVINIWGAVVGYFTSLYRGVHPDLMVETTLYAFPLTYVSCSISMQLGSWLFHKIDMRLQLLIGSLIFAASIYLSQFAETWDQFVMFYSCMAGFGFGIVYFLPVLCGWSYFPHIRPVVAGSILSWFTWIAMGYALYAIHLLNPENEPPNIIVTEG